MKKRRQPKKEDNLKKEYNLIQDDPVKKRGNPKTIRHPQKRR